MTTQMRHLIYISKSGIIFNFLFFLYLLMAIPASVSAEIQTITTVGEYTMGDGETPSVAKQRALEQAIQAASEQAGVYIESYSKTNDFVLTKDEVSILARGVVEVINKQYDEPKILGNSFYFHVTITAKVNTDNIESVRKSLKDKSAVDDLNRLQSAYEESQQEIEKLKQQLAQSSGVEKSNIEQSIAQNEKEFTANQWYKRGLDLQERQKNYRAAIQAYNEAINLNPQYTYAYNNRGLAYSSLQQYEQAISDFDKAIAINPQLAEPYSNRGIVYENLQQYNLAIANFYKATTVNQQYAEAYYNLANIYCSKLQKLEQAITEYNKAISINPQFIEAYNNRGLVYYNLKQYELAIADYNKAIAINPKLANAYYGRGSALWNLNRKQEAINDFRLCIQYGSDDSNFINMAKENIHKMGAVY